MRHKLTGNSVCPLSLDFLLRAQTLEHQFLETGAQKRETKQAGQWGALELHSGSWQGAQQSAMWSNLLQTRERRGKSHLLNTFFSHLQRNLCSCCSCQRGRKSPWQIQPGQKLWVRNSRAQQRWEQQRQQWIQKNWCCSKNRSRTVQMGHMQGTRGKQSGWGTPSFCLGFNHLDIMATHIF